MSMSSLHISFRTDRVDRVPFIYNRFLPLLLMLRLTSSSSPQSSMPYLRNFSLLRPLSRLSNMPSMTVSSQPSRTISDEPLPPVIKSSASTMIDFPAPVSPENTANPSVNSRLSSSIMARSLIRNALSIFYFEDNQAANRDSIFSLYCTFERAPTNLSMP